MHNIHCHAQHPSFDEQTEELIIGCDPDFDAVYDDLDRMFHGIRIQRDDFE